jgi:ABC-2 type transport system ATP-binding protein
MIELEHVSKHYGAVVAVRDVSLRLDRGQVVGLLGPNGAGKSTIIKMIVGLLGPTSGVVRVNGLDVIDQAAAARAGVGYLPEFAPLYPEMTPESYLRFRAGLAATRVTRELIERAMARCHLLEMRSRRISALSKGYRQRVGLAAAIMHEPSVVILDEPTTGLDPTQIFQTRALFRELAQGNGQGGAGGGGALVLLSSHILAEIEHTCDRVVIVARGRVRADGTPRTLLASVLGELATVAEVDGRGGDEARAAGELAATLRSAAGEGEAWSVTVEGGRVMATARRHGEAIDPRSAIALAAQRLGIRLIDLHTPGATLEHVFHRVVTAATREDDAVAEVRP